MLIPYRVVRLVPQTVSRFRAVRELDNKPPRFFAAPTTRFNARISPQRRVSGSRVSMERVKAVQRVFEVKLNDVVIALTSDALRHYLQSRGELPERSLVAQTGMSTRSDSTTRGNQITTSTVRLATDVADPAER